MGHPLEYVLFALLGLVGGCTGVMFTKVLYAIEDICDRVWRGPEWLRPAVVGLVLGLLLLLLPQMYGVGYPVLGNAVAGRCVFAPSLFIGAMLGAAFGEGAHVLAPGIAGPAGAYGLIGMGAVFAGSARAPIIAVVILFELTGEYTIILPLMAAIVLATGISHRLSPDTIYTL